LILVEALTAAAGPFPRAVRGRPRPDSGRPAWPTRPRLGRTPWAWRIDVQIIGHTAGTW